MDRRLRCGDGRSGHACLRGGHRRERALIRQRICHGRGFLGIDLDRRRNATNAALISPDGGRVTVRVIRTNEELMIARSTIRVLNLAWPRST
jgi:acetate kinase